MSGEIKPKFNDPESTSKFEDQEYRERFNRFKVRKYANRQAFQDRRKQWNSEDLSYIQEHKANDQYEGYQFSVEDEVSNVSSESSPTVFLDCIQNEALPSCDNSCPIWSDKHLHDEIENMLSNHGPQNARRVKMIWETENVNIWRNLPGEFFTPSVLHCCLRGNCKMLRFLIQNGANPKTEDSIGRSALHYAASCINADAAGDCIILLRKHGANCDHWDHEGLATPLITAAAYGRVQAVKALLKKVGNIAGANPNALKKSSNGSALIWSIRARNTACAKILIEGGAAVNSPQAYSIAPIHVAAIQGDSSSLRLLLEHQADVRVLLGADRMSALHLAAENGHYECIRLLSAKANCNDQNVHGQTPLHLAALSLSAQSVSALLQAGARHDIYDSDLKTPLHYAVSSEQSQSSASVDIARFLIESGANVNSQDKMGFSPLHLAAVNENSQVASILVHSGADLTAKTKDGITALTYLVRRTPDVVKSGVRGVLDSAILFLEDTDIPGHNDQKYHLDPIDVDRLDCEIKLDFRVLVPNQEDGECCLLMTLVNSGQRSYLQHPVIGAFLHCKWTKIRPLFIISLIFHAAFVLSLTANIMSVFVVSPCHERAVATRNSSQTTANCLYSKWQDWSITLSTYITLAFGTLGAIKEIFQLSTSPLEYIHNPENCAQFFLISGVFIINLPDEWDYNGIEWKQHLASLIVLNSWVGLMMQLGQFPAFGLYVQLFTTVAANIAKFLAAYLSLIIGFSLALAVLFPEEESLAKLPFSLLTTIVMMTGELEYKDYFNADDGLPEYLITTHLVFLAFLLFIVVVLMNLLVGLAVSDIQGLRDSAGLDRLVRQTRLINRMEAIIFSPFLNILPCWVHFTKKFLQRKILVVDPSGKQLQLDPTETNLHCPSTNRIYTLRPNDPRDSVFPADIKNGLLKILISNKRDLKKDKMVHQTLTNDLSNEEILNRMENKIENIVSRIEVLNPYVNQISKLEGQLQEFQKKLDILIALHSRN